MAQVAATVAVGFRCLFVFTNTFVALCTLLAHFLFVSRAK